MHELKYKVKKAKCGRKLVKFKKLEMLKDEMESLSGEGFTGYVKINFSQGSIGRVEKFEEILKEIKEKY